MNPTLGEHLEHLERDLIEPSTRRNRSRLETLLAPDFREVGSSGRTFTRDSILAEFLTEVRYAVVLSEFRCQQLAEDVALVTYKSTRQHGPEPMTRFSFLRSSVWVSRDGRWQLLFHQGTRSAEPAV